MTKIQFDKMTVQDILQHPVWIWSDDDDDETIESCDFDFIPKNGALYHVRITYDIAGVKYHGIIYDIENVPDNFDADNIICAVDFGIFLEGKLYVFSLRPDSGILSKIKQNNIFPISWELFVLFEDESIFRSGMIL